MSKFPSLFKPIKINRMKVKNRLVMPPMVRNYANPDGTANARYLAHIERIAKGGVGMMILEASYIRQDGKGFTHQLGIHDDKCLPGLKKLAEVAHKYGAVIGPQLYHAGRQTSQKVSRHQPVAPSPIPCPLKQEMPHTLTKGEIKDLVASFARAAWRAKEAGMDFVELHGAHGYLITQFLSPFSNKRKDEYGGNFNNRMRFALEVVAAVRAAVGPKFPVTMRLSGDELLGKKGLLLKDTKMIARRLEKAGVDALHISSGNYGTYAQGMMIPPMATKDAPLVKLAAGVKKAVKIPVIAVAKIRTPELAAEILKKKQADMVAIGRPLLADPDWVNKAKAGNAKFINKCIACNQGCITRLFAEQDVLCTVNPSCGRETSFNRPTGRSQKVIVVGGGPAGMSAALTAAARGHRVVLYEKSKKLGGQLFAAAAAPYRKGWEELRSGLELQLKRLKVQVKLGKEFLPEFVKREKADAVIVAIGSSPFKPRIPGIERKNVITTRALLEGRAKAGKITVVVGGGCSGAQTAEYLARRGHQVTIVEKGEVIAAEAPFDEGVLLLGRLAALGVKTIKGAAVKGFGPHSVAIERNGQTSVLPCDTAVLCLGSYPSDGIENEIKPLVKKMKVVGDALEPRRVTDAMAEGALAALSI